MADDGRGRPGTNGQVREERFDLIAIQGRGQEVLHGALHQRTAVLPRHDHAAPNLSGFNHGRKDRETVEEAEAVEVEQESKKDDEQLDEKLKMPIQELGLSVRASNCLEASHIETVGQLTKLSESDLLKLRSFGKTSLREIVRKLADLGLTLRITDAE